MSNKYKAIDHISEIDADGYYTLRANRRVKMLVRLEDEGDYTLEFSTNNGRSWYETFTKGDELATFSSIEAVHKALKRLGIGMAN